MYFLYNISEPIHLPINNPLSLIRQPILSRKSNALRIARHLATVLHDGEKPRRRVTIPQAKAMKESQFSDFSDGDVAGDFEESVKDEKTW